MGVSALIILAKFLFQIVPTLILHHLGAHLLWISCLKTNDGYVAASLKIEQNLGACHHLSNCFDIISGDHQIQ